MKKILAVILIAIVAIVVITNFALNAYVKKEIIREAEKTLNTKVSVGSVDVAPFGGTLRIKDFAIINPEGFSNKNVFEVGEILVTIEKAKKVDGYWQFDIDDVIVSNAQIHNEVNQSGNNIAVLKAVVTNKDEVQEVPNQLKPIAEDSYKNKTKVLVAIDNFEIRNTKIDLTQNIIGQTKSNISLSDIKIRNIGTSDQPIFVEVAFRNVMEKFLNSVVQASVNSGIEGQLQGVIGGAIQDSLDKMGIDAPAAIIPQAPAGNTSPQPEASQPVEDIQPAELNNGGEKSSEPANVNDPDAGNRPDISSDN